MAGHFPLCIYKGGQRERMCFFITGVGAGSFWDCKGLLREFAKLARKVICATFAYKFSPTKIIKTFFLV